MNVAAELARWLIGVAFLWLMLWAMPRSMIEVNEKRVAEHRARAALVSEQRRAACERAGMKPVVEFYGEEQAIVTGCLPKP